MLPVILIYMNIKTITAIVFSFLLTLPVYAEAATSVSKYPEIAGITINETTTAAEYIVYFFNLIVAIGSFIAVVMVIMAGIEWVTAGGNPGKIESAKGKIVNTLFGVAVLLGCYLILFTINPELTSIQIDDLRCDHGIVVTVQEGSQIKQKCIDSNQAEIKDTITNTKSPWNFPDGYLLEAYTYSEPNYKGTVTKFDCGTTTCSGNIAGAKSLYLVARTPGIYLYDDIDLEPASPAVKGYPLFTSVSVPDLSKTNSFDNFTKSIKIIDPKETTTSTTRYIAVAFRDQNYLGRCAFIAQDVRDLDTTDVSGYYTDKIGNSKISSIIVAKSIVDPSTVSTERGEVILYTKTNCGKSDTDPTKQIKACHIRIGSSSGGQVNIFKQTSDSSNSVCRSLNGGLDGKFVPGDEVMSFEITGAAGLVLSTSEARSGNEETRCMYFNKASLGGGTCFSIIDTPVYTVGGKTPQSYIVLPDN